MTRGGESANASPVKPPPCRMASPLPSTESVALPEPIEASSPLQSSLTERDAATQAPQPPPSSSDTAQPAAGSTRDLDNEFAKDAVVTYRSGSRAPRSTLLDVS